MIAVRGVDRGRAMSYPLALGGAVAVFSLVVALAGANPAVAISDVLTGSLRSQSGVEGIVIGAVPLVIIGCFLCPAYTARQYNVGAPGQLLAGAIATSFVATSLPERLPGAVTAFAALMGSLLVGAGLGAASAALKQHAQMNEVISTLLVNYVIVFVLAYLARIPLQDDASFLQESRPVPRDVRLGVLPGTDVTNGALVAVAAVIIIGWFLQRAPLGARARMVGESPEASAAAGVRPDTVAWQTLILSSAGAGLAGAVMILSTGDRLSATFAQTGFAVGFTAILATVIGNLRPVGVAAAALFLSLLNAGGISLQRSQGISGSVVVVLQAVLVLGLLVANRERQ